MIDSPDQNEWSVISALIEERTYLRAKLAEAELRISGQTNLIETVEKENEKLRVKLDEVEKERDWRIEQIYAERLDKVANKLCI